MANLGQGTGYSASNKSVSAEEIARYWARTLGCSEDEVLAVADAVSSAGERMREMDTRRTAAPERRAPWRERLRLLRLCTRG